MRNEYLCDMDNFSGCKISWLKGISIFPVFFSYVCFYHIICCTGYPSAMVMFQVKGTNILQYLHNYLIPNIMQQNLQNNSVIFLFLKNLKRYTEN